MDSSRDLAWWRCYFDGAKVGVFEVINRAIDLAISDFPAQFKVERDAIAQRLFSASLEHQRTLSPSSEVISRGAIDGEVSKDMSASETEGTASNKGKAASEVVTAQSSNGIAKPEGRRPIIRIRFRTKEAAVAKAKPEEDVEALSGKASDLEGMQVRKLSEAPSKGLNGATKLEKGSDPRSECAGAAYRRVNGGAKLEKTLDKKTSFLDEDVEAKLEGTKRKLREAYDRDDLAKRSRTIQLLDSREAVTLQGKKGPKVLTKGQKQLRKLLKGRSSSRV